MFVTTPCLAKQPMSRDALTSAAQLLTRAFLADPLFVHVQPSEAMRRRGLPTLFQALLLDSGPRGGAVSTEQGIVAWIPVHGLQANLCEHIRRGYAKVPFHLGLGATFRLQSHDDWCNRRLAAHAAQDAAYIHCVGVDPALAGQGIGSKLMHAALSHIGASYDVCVLRTENPRNVKFYERLGFRCVEQLKVPVSGLAAWFFVRSV